MRYKESYRKRFHLFNYKYSTETYDILWNICNYNVSEIVNLIFMLLSIIKQVIRGG